MTSEELASVILALKYNYLVCNSVYIKRYRIGTWTTVNRLRELLYAVDLYLQVLDYYYNIPTDEVELGDITEEDILLVIAEADKLLDTYKLYYNDR